MRPKDHQPPLVLPAGTTREEILASLMSIQIDQSPRGELESYASVDCDRFLYTLSMLPEHVPMRVLEIGAGPYFTTMLGRWYRPMLRWEYTNYFGGELAQQKQRITIDNPAGLTESFDLEYWNVNVETMALPFADASFDLVLFCEVLEHMTNDPLACLLEIKRVLRPNGQLIVTTPNVARLENVARLVVGQNLYDPYSGYGPYGRHNREYSQHELYYLLLHAGFETEMMFTGDVHVNNACALVPEDKLEELLGWRASSLGQYLFFRAINAGVAETRRPTWLYRSYPADFLIESVI